MTFCFFVITQTRMSWWWMWPVCENAWESHGAERPWICKEKRGYDDAYYKMNETSLSSLQIWGYAILY